MTQDEASAEAVKLVITRVLRSKKKQEFSIEHQIEFVSFLRN